MDWILAGQLADAIAASLSCELNFALGNLE
jgi:hypothetical protein